MAYIWKGSAHILFAGDDIYPHIPLFINRSVDPVSMSSLTDSAFPTEKFPNQYKLLPSSEGRLPVCLFRSRSPASAVSR